MRNIIRFLIAVVFFSTILPEKVSASHVMGSDLTWKCVGQDSFIIELTVYRDCNGILLSVTPLSFKCSPGGKTITEIYFTSVGTPVDITPVNSFTCTRCQSVSCSFPFGIQRYTMQKLVNLNSAGSCCNIMVMWEQCCRNGAITTGAGGNNFFIQAQLNRCLNPCDNSPVFGNMPVAILCSNQDFTYSHGVFDSDTNATGGLSDSLVFTWTPPLSGYNLPIPYTGQYAYYRPVYFHGFPDTSLALPRGFHLNTETGDVNFRPMKEEVTVMALNVKEYRNGQLIGIIRRDLQLIVISCNVIEPMISSPGTPKKNYVKPGETFTLNFSAIDTSSEDSLFISWNNSIPGAVWTDNNGTTRTPTGTLCWKPETKQLSSLPYLFTVMVRKNSFPMNSQNSQSFQIYVKKTFPTDIISDEPENIISVYPNPAADECLVTTNNKSIKIVSAVLFDNGGRKVRMYTVAGSSELKIKKSGLKAGNYIIRLEASDGKSYVKKFSFK